MPGDAMSFPGHPPKAPAEPYKPRTYEIVIDGQPDTVEADYITRDPGHVCFWKTRPDNLQDTLVTAISNNLLDELKEVTQ
jgi:hypothetical protein